MRDNLRGLKVVWAVKAVKHRPLPQSVPGHRDAVALLLHFGCLMVGYRLEVIRSCISIVKLI